VVEGGLSGWWLSTCDTDNLAGVRLAGLSRSAFFPGRSAKFVSFVRQVGLYRLEIFPAPHQIRGRLRLTDRWEASPMAKSRITAWISGHISRWQRAAEVFVGIVLVTSSFLHGIMENSFVTYPRFIDQKSGRTVPYRTKGIVVYITEEDSALLDSVERIEIISAVAALSLIIVSFRISRSSRP
jgi:hypothetical protein